MESTTGTLTQTVLVPRRELPQSIFTTHPVVISLETANTPTSAARWPSFVKGDDNVTTHLRGVPDTAQVDVLDLGGVFVPVLEMRRHDERTGCERAHRYLAGELQGLSLIHISEPTRPY